jgi:hypothetical protein
MKPLTSSLRSNCLPAIALFCSGALSLASALRPVETNSPIAEPYPPLHGGAFTGPAVAESPDPIQQFRWTAPEVSDELQTYELRPLSVTTDPPGAFANSGSATRSDCQVTVKGPGSIRFDFGVESAAWLEFDSPDLSGEVEMSISEFNQPPRPNAPGKTKAPVRHGNTWRLELNKEFYEGVRFGWIHVRHFDRPWHISAVRLVCQIRPVNYNGSFSCSDPMLTRIWYTGAYAVKLNLLKEYLGAILMDRGDRVSWTGDAYVAQAALLAAFGNWQFIAHNLDYTCRPSGQNDGISSYALYWVLSLLDYYHYSGDAAEVQKHLPDILARLDHGAAIYADPPIGFYGWDERLGAGFEYAKCWEAKNAYRMLFIHTCRQFADAAATLGRPDLRDRFMTLADKLTAELRTNPQWCEPFGIHAAADALNAGFTLSQEEQATLDRQFASRVNRVSYSPFNEYFLLYAMDRLGRYDDALTAVRDCWGGQIAYGGTTFFECYDPSWNAFLRQNDPIPNCQSGFTSLCHPWSSGATKWLTEEVLGIQPTAPGFATVDILPQLGSALTRVSGGVPTPRGLVAAGFDVQSGRCQATIPAGVIGRVGIPKAGRTIASVRINNHLAWDGTYHSIAGVESAGETAEYVRFDGVKGGDYAIRVKYLGHSQPAREKPMEYPLRLLKTDTTTHGDWGGKYGRDGYVLFSYDGAGKDRVQLPSYARSVTPFLAKPGSQDTTWALQTDDHRALAPDLSNTIPRNAGCTYDAPTFHVDVDVQTNTPYSLALYFLDWDKKGRQTTVEVHDLKTFDLIAPIEMVSDYANGKYLVFRCDRPVRLRIDHVRGDNAVLSGLFFDPAPAK